MDYLAGRSRAPKRAFPTSVEARSVSHCSNAHPLSTYAQFFAVRSELYRMLCAPIAKRTAMRLNNFLPLADQTSHGGHNRLRMGEGLHR